MSPTRLWIVALLTSSLLFAQSKPVAQITGIDHAAVYASDMAKARTFYKDLLGFDEPFRLKDAAGNDWITFIKINDVQFLELFAGDEHNRGQLDHFALSTRNAANTRDYLVAHGVQIVQPLHKGRTGNYFFTVRDPDGHPIEIVEAGADSWTGKAKGKFMPAGRVSTRIMHIGLLVKSAGPALKFYRDILGFQEFTRQGASGENGFIDLRIPGSDEFVELILYQGRVSAEQMKAQNHICLASPDINKTITDLQFRELANAVPFEQRVHAENSRPSHADLFDPDGARIEIMQSVNIDGKAGKLTSVH